MPSVAIKPMILSIIMLSVAKLSVIMQNAILLSVILLTIILLGVILLNVILKTKEQTGISQYFLNSRGTACLHDNNTLKINSKPFFSVACSNIHIHEKLLMNFL